MAKKPKRSVAAFLDRLETRRDEALASSVVFGRAVSKSDENLHLATAGGIVAIPISEIESIEPTGTDAALVSVQVRNASRVRSLTRFRLGGIFTDPIFGDPIGPPIDGGGGNTIICYSTSTQTGPGGAPDASDDEICRVVDMPA